MSLDRYVIFDAVCDVRVRQGQPFGPGEFAALVEAWQDAGRPDHGPAFEALGVRCPVRSDHVYDDNQTKARTHLEKKGWGFRSRGRRLGWYAACPDHRKYL